MGKHFFAAIFCLLLAACAQPRDSVDSVVSRSWRSDDGITGSLRLTVSDDGNAELFMHGPARSVPHWGELDYPQEWVAGKIHRIEARTFAVFEGKELRVLEIAERSKDRLVVWFRRGIDVQGEVDAQLRALPPANHAPDLELSLVSDRERQSAPAGRSAPATRFTI